MKHSWLRLFSSVYILLVSVLLIVISAYAWMVISTSPSAGGANFGIAGKELWGEPEFKFDQVWDGNMAYEDQTTIVSLNTIEKDASGAYIIRTGEDLFFMASYINSTDNLGDITMKIVNSIDMASETTDFDLDSIFVKGQSGVGKVTIIGAKTDETGAIVETGLRLKKPLFSGGFAGNSAIVIENITIINSTIISTNTIGSGAFIDYVDSMQEITLTGCHLKNSTVTGGADSRTGGLIGYTTGYSNVNDGAVKTYVTVTNCSVENSTVNSQNSAGGIIGHSGASDWTYTVVENCTVKNTKLNSTDSGGWRVGEIVGTANAGEMIVKNCETEKVALSQMEKTFPDGQDKSYGRLALGSTGNYTVIDENKAKLWGVFTQLAADNLTSESQVWELHGTVNLGWELRFQGSNIQIVGADGIPATINLNSHATGYTHPGQSNAASGFNFGALNENVNTVKAGSVMEFSNIIFANNKTVASGVSTAMRTTIYAYAYSESVRYTDCTFTSGVITYGNASFVGCSFNEDDSGMYCVFLDNEYGGMGYVPEYIIKNCTFNGNSSAYGGLKVADDKNEGAILHISGSTFTNIVNKAAVYVNGKTAVIATNNTFSACAVGDFGFKGENCTYNGSKVSAGNYTADALGAPTDPSSAGTSTATSATTTPAQTTSEATTTTTTTASAETTVATTTASAETTAATTTASAETTATTASVDVTTSTTAPAETTATTASAEVTTSTTAPAETTAATASAEVTTTTTTSTEATTPSEEPMVSTEETTTPATD